MPYAGIQTMVEETTAVGGDIELVSLEGITHGAWAYAYDNTVDGNYYNWLASFYNDGPPETVEPIEDRVTTFVVINDRGKIVTESGNVYEVPLTKIE
jgi:hypothetical protein